MKRLHKLLFELANAERMGIMLELQKKNLKLSHLSRRLELTAPETSRNLQRLSETMLIEKNSEGYFTLTQFGRLTLLLLKDLLFLSLNREYFSEYDVSAIPAQYLSRLGELAKIKYVDKAILNLQEGENRIKQASKYVWIMSDEVLKNVVPCLADKIKTAFDLRIILPSGMFPPEHESRLPSRIPYVQKRVQPKVNALIVLTEDYSVFCLPNHTGKIDYTGFAGIDDKFHEWCKDLFLYYWERSIPLSRDLPHQAIISENLIA